MEPVTFQASAQENTTMIDQSIEKAENAQNLSSSNKTPSSLTRQDLNPLLNNLFKARELLLNNNITGSFDSVNLASGELLRLNISLATSDSGTKIHLYPLQSQIESARSSLLNNNSTLAIKYLNNADTQFVILTQQLSEAQ